MGGLETFVFRLASSLSRGLSTLLKKKLIIINENELLIEASLRYLFKGYVPISFSTTKNPNLLSTGHCRKLFLAKPLLNPIVSKRISTYVNNSFRTNCLKFFFEQLNETYKSYQSWHSYFEKEINNLYANTKKTLVFSNHPASPKGLAAKNILNKKKIKLISFQHGVTAEISASHNYCLSQHDSAAIDE
tara:strand:- start:197 stop:763 length:567 start_codon:yes stop_codon:yes gene_type:complete